MTAESVLVGRTKSEELVGHEPAAKQGHAAPVLSVQVQLYMRVAGE